MLRSLVALLALDHDILLRVRVLSFSFLLEEELSGKSWSKAAPFHAAGPRVETCGASVGAWSVVGADAAAPAAAGGVCGASPLADVRVLFSGEFFFSKSFVVGCG